MAQSAFAQSITIQQDAEIMEVSKCVICLEKYNKTTRAPVSASCGHTFCKRCVNRVVTFKTFSCCVCRRTTFLGSSVMLKNLTILTLLEKMGQLDTDDSDDDSLSVQSPTHVGEGLMLNATAEAKEYVQQYLAVLSRHFSTYTDDTEVGMHLFVAVFNLSEALGCYLDNRSNVANRYMSAFVIEEETDSTALILGEDELEVLNNTYPHVRQMIEDQEWAIGFRYALADEEEEEDDTYNLLIDETVQDNAQPEARLTNGELDFDAWLRTWVQPMEGAPIVQTRPEPASFSPLLAAFNQAFQQRFQQELSSRFFAELPRYPLIELTPYQPQMYYAMPGARFVAPLVQAHVVQAPVEVHQSAVSTDPPASLLGRRERQYTDGADDPTVPKRPRHE